MVSPILCLLLVFFGVAESVPTDICYHHSELPMCQRMFAPPSKPDVEHICVKNPNLPACGHDFCEKHPEAAGCPKTRRVSFSEDDAPITLSERQKKFCARNPDDKFCQIAPRSWAPPSKPDVEHICVKNPNLPACGHDFCEKHPEAAGCPKTRDLTTADWKDWNATLGRFMDAYSSVVFPHGHKNHHNQLSSEASPADDGMGSVRIYGKVRGSDDVQTQIRYV